MSLRARLLIGLVVLVAAGLGAAAIVTYEEQRSFLLTRVNQQVADSRIPVCVALGLDANARAGPKPGQRWGSAGSDPRSGAEHVPDLRDLRRAARRESAR